MIMYQSIHLVFKMGKTRDMTYNACHTLQTETQISQTAFSSQWRDTFFEEQRTNYFQIF